MCTPSIIRDLCAGPGSGRYFLLLLALPPHLIRNEFQFVLAFGWRIDLGSDLCEYLSFSASTYRPKRANYCCRACGIRARGGPNGLKDYGENAPS